MAISGNKTLKKNSIGDGKNNYKKKSGWILIICTTDDQVYG
jgi:hypothetical protein